MLMFQFTCDTGAQITPGFVEAVRLQQDACLPFIMLAGKLGTTELKTLHKFSVLQGREGARIEVRSLPPSLVTELLPPGRGTHRTVMGRLSLSRWFA